jgi:hypothetical protein
VPWEQNCLPIPISRPAAGWINPRTRAERAGRGPSGTGFLVVFFSSVLVLVLLLFLLCFFFGSFSNSVGYALFLYSFFLFVGFSFCCYFHFSVFSIFQIQAFSKFMHFLNSSKF